MTTTTTIILATRVITLCMLLLNIEMKCATNIQLPAEKNKELFLEKEYSPFRVWHSSRVPHSLYDG